MKLQITFLDESFVEIFLFQNNAVIKWFKHFQKINLDYDINLHDLKDKNDITNFSKHWNQIKLAIDKLKQINYTFPFLISIIYSRSFPSLQIWEIFQERLHIGATIAESTVVGAKRFMKCNEKSNAYDAIIGVLSSLFCECISRFIGFILVPLVRIRFIQNKEVCEY